MSSTPVGTPLPGGTYRVSAADDARVRAALGAPPATGRGAHPAFAFIAAQRGMGLSLEELLALADARVEDGPMLGSCRLDLRAELLVETTYSVSGRIAGLERKTGRRAGTFDLLTVELTATGPDGAAALACANVYVLPRR